ncbi:hypothetical protein CR513_48082, partial [Mucuna pruriens]
MFLQHSLPITSPCQWNKAKKDKTEAPTKEPTTVAEAALLGPGAGADTSAVAKAALTEAAAMRAAQATFLMSMMDREVCGETRLVLVKESGLRFNGVVARDL